MMRCLLLCLLSGLLLSGASGASRLEPTPVWSSSAAPHPGPPVFMEVVIFEKKVQLRIQGEQVVLCQWLGYEGTVFPKDLSDAQRTELAKRAAGLLRKQGSFRIDRQDAGSPEIQVSCPEALSSLFQQPAMKIQAEYPCSTLPRSVTLLWHEFARMPALYGEPEIPITTRCGSDIDFYRVNRKEPELTWHASAPRKKRKIEVQEAPPKPQDYPLSAIAVLLALSAGLGGYFRGRVAPIQGLVLAAVLMTGAVSAWKTELLPIRIPLPSRIEIPEPDEAIRIFEKIHSNLYLAFEAKTEDEIYERLAKSVKPELLDDLYAEIYENLILRSEGGAVCRITKLEELDKKLEKVYGKDQAERRPGFVVDWRWRVHGEVAHWGHRHTRILDYHAKYSVEQSGGAWKIADVEILDLKRVDK